MKFLYKLIYLLIIFFSLMFLVQLIKIDEHKIFTLRSIVYADHDEGEDDDHEEEDEEEDEDDDEDDEHEDDDDDYDEYEEYYEPNTTNLGQVSVENSQKTVVRYITIIDPGYDIDTDKDKLVDALDPNPNVYEPDFFTDDDQDGISNYYDKYKGEDDFLYMQFYDDNLNGISDDLE